MIIYPWKRAGPFIFKCQLSFFLLLPNYLPFGKGVALHLSKLESPSPRDILCQVWLKLAQLVLEKKIKMLKVYRQTDGHTDGQTNDGRQVIRKAHLSFQLRLAKNVQSLVFQLIRIFRS